jgi:hypothetical protein
MQIAKALAAADHSLKVGQYSPICLGVILGWRQRADSLIQTG